MQDKGLTQEEMQYLLERFEEFKKFRPDNKTEHEYVKYFLDWIQSQVK